MERKVEKKLVLLLLVICLILQVVVGVNAYYYNSTHLDNPFELTKPEVYLSEKFDETDKWVPGEEKQKEVSFGNSGTMDALLRVKFTPTLKTKDGKSMPIDGCTLNFAAGFDGSTGQWVESHEGTETWYYYKSVLKAGEKTPTTLKSVTISDLFSNDVHGIKTDYSGATFTVEVDAQFIQASHADAGAVDNNWGKTPTVSGSSVSWS